MFRLKFSRQNYFNHLTVANSDNSVCLRSMIEKRVVVKFGHEINNSIINLRKLIRTDEFELFLPFQLSYISNPFKLILK